MGGKGGHSIRGFNVTALDFVTNEKYEEYIQKETCIETSTVTSRDYELLDIQSDGTVSVLLDDGSAKEDLKLPTDVHSKKVFILSS